MKRTFSVRVYPHPSILARPEEILRIAGKSIVVSMECSQFGKVNRRKLTRIAIERCKAEFFLVCPLGGFGLGAFVETEGGAK